MRSKRQKEDAVRQGYFTLLGMSDKLPDEVNEQVWQAVKTDKNLKDLRPVMDVIQQDHGKIRKGEHPSFLGSILGRGQGGGGPVSSTTPAGDGGGIDAKRTADMAQGPPQVAPMPGMAPMEVARTAQPQEPPAPEGPPMSRMGPQYSQAQPPVPPTRLADMPQPVTPSPFRPIPPMPGTPEARGGQPSADRAGTPGEKPVQAGGTPSGKPENQWEKTRRLQDERTLRVYKSQQDILRENKIAEEKAKEASGGMKSNFQRVVFKNPADGSLIRADQDMRKPGTFYNPGTGAPMAGPMPGTEVLTESELDRDDAAAVRKQEYDEKQAAKKEKEQQDAADIDQVVDAIVKGHQPPDMSRMYGKSLKVKAAMARKYPDFNLANAELDYRGMQRWISTQQGPQMVKLRGATNFAVEGLDTLDAPRPADWKKGDPDPKDSDLIGRAAKTAAGSKYKRLNRAYLDAAKNGVFGEQAASDATRLDVQIAELQQELAVVYKGGNSPTDLGLNKAGEMLKSEWSDRVLRDAIDLGRTNLRIRLNSIKHTLPESVSGGANPYAPQPGASPFAPLPQMPGGPAPAGGAVAGAGGDGAAATPPLPTVGEVRDGYRFKGGHPGKQENWEKVQ